MTSHTRGKWKHTHFRLLPRGSLSSRLAAAKPPTTSTSAHHAWATRTARRAARVAVPPPPFGSRRAPRRQATHTPIQSASPTDAHSHRAACRRAADAGATAINHIRPRARTACPFAPIEKERVPSVVLAPMRARFDAWTSGTEAPSGPALVTSAARQTPIARPGRNASPTMGHAFRL
jgi:hypothetical protein